MTVHRVGFLDGGADGHIYPTGERDLHDWSPACRCSPVWRSECVAVIGYASWWEHRVLAPLVFPVAWAEV